MSRAGGCYNGEVQKAKWGGISMLPGPLQDLWGVWRDIEGSAKQTVLLNLVGPQGPERQAIAALLLEGSPLPSALRVLEAGLADLPEADIHLLLVEPDFGPTHEQLKSLRKLPPQRLIILLLGIPQAALESRKREVATSIGVRAEQVVAAGISELRPALTKQLLALFAEHAVPLARQFPFLRDAAAELEISQTSRQNALVGVIPLPGADFPVMTANQVKMVLRLAAMFDQTLNPERLKEVLAVVGGGFALRSLARQVAKFIPGPGWIVGGAMGYGGTLTMGKAALEYFRRALPVQARPHDSDDAIDARATVVEPQERRP
jgi:uncharacterized protein (DUF697 family)